MNNLPLKAGKTQGTVPYNDSVPTRYPSRYATNNNFYWLFVLGVFFFFSMAARNIGCLFQELFLLFWLLFTEGVLLFFHSLFTEGVFLFFHSLFTEGVFLFFHRLFTEGVLLFFHRLFTEGVLP